MPKSNVGAQFACDLCPKMCGNAGSLAVHKSMIHPTNPTPASSSFFVPRQASACPKFPTPFWKQLFVVGVASVAVVMAGRARFERYTPPTSKSRRQGHQQGIEFKRTEKLFPESAYLGGILSRQ